MTNMDGGVRIRLLLWLWLWLWFLLLLLLVLWLLLLLVVVVVVETTGCALGFHGGWHENPEWTRICFVVFRRI